MSDAFADFLREDGTLDAANADAMKRVSAFQLAEAILRQDGYGSPSAGRPTTFQS